MLVGVGLAGLQLGWWSVAPEPARHVVVRGDTLWALSKSYGVSVPDIRAWNGLQGDTIEVGQSLVVSLPGAASDVPPAPPAPARSARRTKRRSSGGSVSAGSAAPPPKSRSLPAEQACLAGPSDAPDGMDDEASFAASEGLSLAQIRGAMDAATPSLFHCVPDGSQPNGTLELDIVVACTGRVAAVAVLDDDGLPDALVTCVRDELGYAAFPPHDMPDGMSFGYPLRFTW